jgi:hypothetical protein
MKHLLIVAIFLVSCQPTIPSPPRPVQVDCQSAQDRLDELKCDVAPRFLKACTYHASKGYPYNVKCIKSSLTCNEAEKCSK